MNKPKAKGTAWESAIVRYLRECGVTHAERRTLAGANDRGDIAGLPGVVIEAKNAASYDLAGWVREAEAERFNAGAAVGFAWAKRRGRVSPADGYVVMSGAQLVKLLRDAGYIAPPGRPLESVAAEPATLVGQVGSTKDLGSESSTGRRPAPDTPAPDTATVDNGTGHNGRSLG